VVFLSLVDLLNLCKWVCYIVQFLSVEFRLPRSTFPLYRILIYAIWTDYQCTQQLMLILYGL